MSKTYQDVAIELQKELDIAHKEIKELKESKDIADAAVFEALEEIIELQSENKYLKNLVDGYRIIDKLRLEKMKQIISESEDSEDDNSL